MKRDTIPCILFAVVMSIALWSGVNPHDRFTWILETFPAFLAIGILFATRRKFYFTDLAYSLIALHCVVLLVGGHYTYTEVPLFNWLRDDFNLARNYYDRVGHFVQGFVPAMVARELLLRTSPLTSGKWLFVIIVLSCLGISAWYEIFEWGVATLTGEAADSFLGTQGDIWDTQKDMIMAFIGAISALITLSGWHDRTLEKIKS
jgi:putative membrane protein